MKEKPAHDELSPLSEGDKATECLDDILAEADDAIADFLDAADSEMPGETGLRLSTTRTGRQDMESTFLSLMRNNLKPVTRYVKALPKVKHHSELYEIIDLTVSPVAELAAEAQMFELSRLLGELAQQCQEASKINGDARLRRAKRQEVIQIFQKLSCKVDLSFRGHEPAVKNLLRFYHRIRMEPQFPSEYIRKFFAVGIPSVSWVCRTSENEISSLSGIPPHGVKRLRKLARRSQKKAGFLNAGVDLSHLIRMTTDY